MSCFHCRTLEMLSAVHHCVMIDCVMLNIPHLDPWNVIVWIFSQNTESYFRAIWYHMHINYMSSSYISTLRTPIASCRNYFIQWHVTSNRGRLASLRHLGNRFNLAGFHRFSDSTEYAYPFRTEFIWDYTDITSTLLEGKDSFTQKC